jgi:hypothetical protein
MTDTHGKSEGWVPLGGGVEFLRLLSRSRYDKSCSLGWQDRSAFLGSLNKHFPGDLASVVRTLQALFIIPEDTEFCFEAVSFFAQVWIVHDCNSSQEGTFKAQVEATSDLINVWGKLLTVAAHARERFDAFFEVQPQEIRAKKSRLIAKAIVDTDGLSSAESVSALTTAEAQIAAIYSLAHVREPEPSKPRARGRPRGQNYTNFDNFLSGFLVVVLEAGGSWTFEKNDKHGSLAKALETLRKSGCLPPDLIPPALTGSRVQTIQKAARDYHDALVAVTEPIPDRFESNPSPTSGI